MVKLKWPLKGQSGFFVAWEANMHKNTAVCEDKGVRIIQQGAGPQSLLSNYIQLLMNYQYGLQVDTSKDWNGRDGEHLASSVFWLTHLQGRLPQEVEQWLVGEDIPFFLLCPNKLIDFYTNQYRPMKNVHICPWEKVFVSGPDSLQHRVYTVFVQSSIDNLHEGFRREGGVGSGRRLMQMLNGVETLPTMPQLVLRIMRLVNDPKSTAADLEKLLTSDGAIVHKLIQVVNSPIFSGQKSRPWTLKEAIVRLGRREVGTIAQQVKLINSFIKPGDSTFDLRRYWVHAVGSAVLADRICRDKIIPIKAKLNFNDYWLGALLHDVGKLVLGSFYSDYFHSLIRCLRTEGQGESDFRRIEERFGDIPDHEYIGRLLMLKAKMPRGIIDAVGNHHVLGQGIKPLASLVHLAENMCKDLGFGYLPEERGVYQPAALRLLGVDEGGIRQAQSHMGKAVLVEIQEMVDQCLA